MRVVLAGELLFPSWTQNRGIKSKPLYDFRPKVNQVGQPSITPSGGTVG